MLAAGSLRGALPRRQGQPQQAQPQQAQQAPRVAPPAQRATSRGIRMLTEMVMLLPSALKVGVTLKVGVSGVKVAMFLVALL